MVSRASVCLLLKVLLSVALCTIAAPTVSKPAPKAAPAPKPTNTPVPAPALKPGISVLYRGKGAYNNADFAPNGHCSFGKSNALNLQWRKGITSIAINRIQYNTSSICGLCIAYRGTKTNSGFSTNWKYGIVSDECKNCKFGEIVVYGAGSGYHDVEWQAVQCNVAQTSFQYTFQGSNMYYLKLSISNTRVPVAAVKLAVNKKFVSMTRTVDNFWEYNPLGRKITFPLTLQITSFTGDTVVETLKVSQPTGTVPGKAQFALKPQFAVVQV